MDEKAIKEKIQEAYHEPRAPEELIEKVVLRSRAVALGVKAQKELENDPAVEKLAALASRVLIGQLAAVSELPKGTQPEQLARQLEQHPAFAAGLRGGNVVARLNSGRLLQQITGQAPTADQASPEISAPKKEGPALG